MLGAMPLVNDYSLCRQTVTVYHFEDGEVTRTVHSPAYLEGKINQAIAREGSAQESSFLLVVPGAEPACAVGDKVVEGEGPDVPATDVAAWWRAFIPTKVDGLWVVRSVALRRWNGGIVHTEAEG